jgi:enoyl-CoA hydratase/carnithine racemase
MTDQEIRYEVADRVATVTLNRPAKLNAWTPQMEREVQAALLQADADDNVCVVVLTGEGRAFCAGADLQTLQTVIEASRSEAELKQLMAQWPTAPQLAGARADFQKTYSYFPAVGKPVIAAINGPVIGLGLVVALYCDLRLASDEAKFSTAFAKRGLIAEHGIAWMLPRLIGIANALDLLFSARTIDAEEALRMGLISQILPRDSFADDVQDYAADLAANVSPRSLRVIKKQVYDGLFQTLAEATDTANREMVQSVFTADFREGVAHFLEKRPPAFTGK